jgi:hypothetical protein
MDKPVQNFAHRGLALTAAHRAAGLAGNCKEISGAGRRRASTLAMPTLNELFHSNMPRISAKNSERLE